MAQGDWTVFDQFLLDLLEKRHDCENDTFKMFITDGTTTLAATTADPRYGAGGTTNLASEEVAAGGNYVAGGATMTNPSAALSAGVAVFDADDPAQWDQHASNPTDARYGVVYNDTDTGKRCVGFVDLGATFDMTTGPLDINVNANGLVRLDQA